jgi:uncharacterized protein YkwD
MRIFRFAGVAAILMLSGLLPACQITDIFTDGGGSGVSGSGFVAMNDIRRNAGLKPLSPDARLERAAMRQAGYMAQSDRMEHDTGWGRDFARRMKQDGVGAPAAENLAHGRMDVARVFQMWEASAGHRRNMLDPRFTRYGLAHAAAADGRRYWALVLGR